MFLIIIMFTMSGCELVGDVLEFGVWVGIIIVVVVILIIVWIFNKLRR